MTTIYYNGKIHTMDEKLNIVTAMAVCGGKIAALGTDTELRNAYPDADSADLQGKTVIPGLIDTHAHIFMVADSEGDGEMFIPTTIDELLSDVKKRVKESAPGTWITYKNTYPLRLLECRYPTREELDAVAPKHPVSVDGYYSAQLNSAALRALELSKLPPGGRIIEESGTLLNCFSLLVPHYKTRTKKAQSAAIKEAMAAYNSYGITTSVEGMSTREGIAAVEELQKEDKQTVRLRYTMMVPGENHKEFAKSVREIASRNREFARVGFLKNTIDGGILTGTSLMEDAYKNKERAFNLYGVGENFRGTLVSDVDVLAKSIELAQEENLQYGAHCVGSEAAKKLLSAYAIVNEKSPTEGRRHVLIHADFMDKEMLKTAKKLDLTVLFQPAWHYMDAPFMEQIVSARECFRFLPYMDIKSSGVHAAAGSDHMVKYDGFKSVNPYNPFIGMYNMVSCAARDGAVYGESQRIDRISALRYYTSDAAYAVFDEKLTGSLIAGNRADFLVLDRDYFTCPEGEIINIRPERTYVDGKCVYKG
ncbi:MAG: amidohydrolase family protein [Clostridia bacterium]